MSKKRLPQLSFVFRTGSQTQFTRSNKRVAKIPAALFDWASTAAQLFWQDHGRCIVVLLFYHPASTNWILELPKQECTSEGCKWSIAREDLPHVEDNHFLAGSLQTFGNEPPEALEHLVPLFAGMHFLVRTGAEAVFHAFVREGSGACTKVDVESLVLDDRDISIAEAIGRFELV